ncbi:MAG: flagellin [Acidimicrobiales bacterium]
MRINNNVAAFNANRNLSSSNMSLGKSLEKLSSGFRINRAGDDAAGLTISQGLRAQASGLKQATRNAQDGISVVQTAEGALTEVHSMLNRMRDLAVQAANTGSQDSNAIAASQEEFAALRSEITRIADTTKFGSKNLLDGTFGTSPAKVTGFDADNSITHTAGDDFTININGTGAVTVDLPAMAAVSGSEAAASIESAINSALSAASNAYAGKVSVKAETLGAGTTLTLEVSGLDDTETFVLADGTGTPLADMALTGTVTAASGTAGSFQVGANAGEAIEVSIDDVDAAGLNIDALDLTTDADAAITALDTAIGSVSTTRSELGALQNRFESTINNLQVSTENIVASESRIRDTDMATEMTNFTKQQILQQAGTAMLGQANSLPQGVLRLLG